MKIKVLQVIGTLHIGGAENVAVNLYRNVDKEKYQMDYLVYDDEVSEYTNEVEQMGGKVIRATDLLNDRMDIENKLVHIMKEYGPYDIVHAHLMHHNGYVMSAAFKAGVKRRISHAHSTNDGKSNKSVVRYIYKKIMTKKIKKYATDFVSCGIEAGKYLYGKVQFKKKGVIINNRIDAEKFRYSIEKYNNLRECLNFKNDKVLLIVGHLIPLKNHKFVFEVFKKMNDRIPNLMLYVLGEGELFEQLNQWVKENNLEEKIIFKGNVNNVNEYMIASDLLLMPSWYEGLPVTLIEAQAAGLQCIVSNGITKEADISGNMSYLPINEGIDSWMGCIEEKLTNERKDMYEYIVRAEYDKKSFGEWLDQFYS